MWGAAQTYKKERAKQGASRLFWRCYMVGVYEYPLPVWALNAPLGYPAGGVYAFGGRVRLVS